MFVGKFFACLGTVLLLNQGLTGADTTACEKICLETFNPHTTNIDKGHESCIRGCRLFALISDAEKRSEDGQLSTSATENLKNCKHSCEDAFEKGKDRATSISACQAGCEYQSGPTSELEKEPQVDKDVVEKEEAVEATKKPEEDTIIDEAHEEPSDTHEEKPIAGIPTLNIELQSIFDDDNDFMMDMPKWMRQMHSSMREMHNRMMSWVRNAFDDNSNEDIGMGMRGHMGMRGPTGMRGPMGQHHMGMGQHHIGNDMMSKPNPLDRFFDPANFEMVDSKEDSKSDESGLIGNRVFEIEIIGPYQMDSAEVDGINFRDGLETPKLPNQGLRSQGSEELVYLDRVCGRNSKEMSWSDFVSCVHHRMRTPRWLTIATISLSIIFIIWLCLVIPQNAPKQRVAKEKHVYLIGGSAKEKEAAASLVSVKVVNEPLIPNDLPPAYDEVSNLQVRLDPAPVPAVDESKVTKI